MKTFFKLLISMFTVLIVIFSGCKKDTTSSGNPSAYLQPTLKDTLLVLPSQIQTEITTLTNQGDYTLAATLETLEEYASFINVWSSGLTGAFLITPSICPGYSVKNNSDGSTSYSYTFNGLGVTLTFYNSSGDSWWKYYADSAGYSKELYYIDNKGTSGTIDWYNSESIKSQSTVLSLSETWSISNNTTSATFNFYNNDGSLTQTFSSTSTSSKSGTLLVTGQNNNTGPLVKQWSFTWTSTGTGSYIEYDPTGTTIISQGSWL